jgi:hypothetical protein
LRSRKSGIRSWGVSSRSAIVLADQLSRSGKALDPLVSTDTPEHWQHSRGLLTQYAASLDCDLSFQDFHTESVQLAF